MSTGPGAIAALDTQLRSVVPPEEIEAAKAEVRNLSATTPLSLAEAFQRVIARHRSLAAMLDDPEGTALVQAIHDRKGAAGV